jgi:F0F1-type ATP synthase membrane subunit c/vacuolar-type H+-ATPase subunit K
MTQQGLALKMLRTLQAAFILSVVLYAFVGEKFMALSATAPASPLVTGFTVVAMGMMLIALIVRSRMVGPARERLEAAADDLDALKRWRLGTLISFVLIESVALYGFVLRVLGATRSQAAPFYLAAIVTMLIWTPRLDLGSSGSA